MGLVGSTIYIDFWVVDNLTPVPGRTLSDWNIVFRRNDVPCTDTLSLEDHGDGHYTVKYVPSAAGHDYLEIYDPLYDNRFIDVEDNKVDSNIGTNIMSLDQNYGGINNLQIKVSNPTKYLLYVYRASDWIAKHNSTLNALGYTALDSQGNWINPIDVPPDAYTLVLVHDQSFIVVVPLLQVTL